MPFKSQKVVEKNKFVAIRRAIAGFLVFAITFSGSTISVFAESVGTTQSQFLTSDVLTSEITKLSEVKPELAQNFADSRKEKISDASDSAEKWTERIVLGKLENGAALDEVVGRRKDAEKVVADLKSSGAITTLADATTGAEKEIDPTLKKSSGDILETNATPYSAEFSADSGEPLIISENASAAGDVVSSTSNDKQVAEDTTPDTTEAVRYFNWNTNAVDGEHFENKIIYPNLWDATDLLVTAGETGMKEDLILKNALAPTSFEYVVETVGLELKTTDDGGYVFVDADGNEKFYTPPPNLTDADGQFVEDGIRYELGWSAPEKIETKTADESAEIEIAPELVDARLAEIKFDENSGTEFSDEKSEKVGTIDSEFVNWTNRGFQNSALFFGGKDGVQIESDFETPAAITMSAWVFPGAFQNSRIVKFGGNSIEQGDDNDWFAKFALDGSNYKLEWTSTILHLEKWTYLVATFDGSEIKLFVDGKEEKSLPVSRGLAPVDGPITIGGGEGNVSQVVDEVQILDRALSPDEVAASYQKYLSEQTQPVVEITVVDESEIVPEVEEEITVIDESELENSDEEIVVVEEENLDEEIPLEPTDEPTDENSESTEPETADEEIVDEDPAEEITEPEIPEEIVEEIPEPDPEVVEPEPEEIVPEEIPTENSEPEAVDEAPATEPEIVEPAPVDEAPAESETPVETSFFESIKNFFAPTALAEIEQFDDEIAIADIVESSEPVEETLVEEIVEPEVVDEPAEEIVEEIPTENSEPEIVAPEEAPAEPESEIVEETPVEEIAVVEEILTEPENSETEIVKEIPAEEIPEEITEPEIVDEPEEEIVVVEEEETATEDEIEVIEESEVEDFFVPTEVVEETRIKIAPESEIVVLTEQEVFAQSNQISEEMTRSDGAIVRRYKLRLVIDVAEIVSTKSTTIEAVAEIVEEIPEEIIESEPEEIPEPEVVEPEIVEPEPEVVEPEIIEPEPEVEEVPEEEIVSEEIPAEEIVEPETPAEEIPEEEIPAEEEVVEPEPEEVIEPEIEVVDEVEPEIEEVIPPADATESETPDTENSADEPTDEIDSTAEEITIDAANLSADLVEVAAAETEIDEIDLSKLPTTLTLASGVELKFPIDVDPSTYVTLVNRGARTFAPDFADGVSSGEYSQTNVPGSINRGTEAATGAQIALGDESSNLRDGLVGYWKMDDDWTDSSENSNDGTAIGGATFDSSGKFNSAGSFDGVDDYIDLGNSTDFQFGTGDFAIGVWLKIPTTPSTNKAIIQKRTDANLGYEIGVSNTMHLYASGAAQFTSDLYTSETLDLNRWYYIVVKRESGVTSLYLDGSSLYSYNNTISASSDNNLYFARDSLNSRYSSYIFDDVAIYSRALSATEISEIYAGGRTSAASSKVLAVDATGTEFAGHSLDNSQNWTTTNGALQSNSVGTKIKFETEISASEIWAGLDFSPAGGVVRATIDPASSAGQALGADQEITTEIDTFAASAATSQKVLLATGLRNSTHTVELELLEKANPRLDNSDANNYRFAIEYFEIRKSESETAGAGIASTADSGSTTTLVDAALAQSDDYWNGYSLEFTSGANNGEVVFVTNFDADSDTITFTPAIDTAITTETFRLSPDGILVNSRATRGLNFNSTNAQNATFEDLDNFPTESDGTVKKGTISIWVAPDFASDADTAKHFVFDNGLARIYFDGSDDKFKFEIYDGDDWTTVDVESAAQNFSAHDSLHLVASFESETGIKLFIDGVKTAKSVSWTPQNISTADSKISFGKCGTRSATVLTAAETYLSGVLAEPQIWNYVLLDSEIFGIFNSSVPSIAQSHTQKIEANSTDNSTLLFNAPLVNAPTDRVGTLAGGTKLDSSVLDADRQNPNWIDDGRFAYFKFDGDLTDSSGSHDGTAIGNATGTSDGKFGAAETFDGTGDYVQVADSADLDLTGNFTFSAWVKPETLKDYGNIVWKSSNDTTSGYGLITFADGHWNWQHGDGGWSDTEGGAVASLANGEWTFVTVTFDGTNVRTYTDGVLHSTDPQNAIVADAYNLEIGGDSYNSRDFDGTIDDVAFYNRALSSNEIAQLFEKGSLRFTGDPLAQSGGVLNSDSLVGFWKMDGDATDALGSLDGTATGGATFDAGRFESAAILDGSDDYINVGDTDSEIKSLAFWIFPENNSRDIIDLDGGTHFISISSGTLAATGFDSPTIFVDGVEGSTISTNSWHHIAITTTTAIDTNAFKIGKNSTFFDGKIDEVALFSRALSASEIAAIYAANSGNFASMTTAEATREIVAGFDVGPDRGIAKVTIDAGTPAEIKTEVDTYAATAASNQRFLVATNLDSKKHSVRIENSNIKNPSATAGLVVPKFVEGNSTNSIAASSLEMNSRLVDDVLVPDYSDFGNGIIFPEKGNISEIENSGTLEFWATGSVASGDHFVDTRDSSGLNGARIYMNSASSLTFEFKNASTAISIADADFSSTYSSAAANHIAARWWRPTATTFGMSLYLNGIKIAENISQNFTPSGHSQISLGNDGSPDSSADFDGAIFDFAIYSAALDDGGVALGALATPNSEVWSAARSRASKIEKIASTTLDSDTTVNSVDGVSTTFYLERGAIAQKVFAAQKYLATNRDTSVELNLASEDNVALAQQFQLDAAGTIPAVSLLLKKVGAPTGNLSLKIETDSSGLPSGTTITNGTATTRAVDTISSDDFEWVTFEFATPPSLSANTKYHLVLEGTFTASVTNNLVWAADTSSPDFENGTSEIKDAAWTESSEDFIFQIFATRSLANSIDAFENGREISVASANAGSFARVDERDGVTAIDTSFSIDSIIDEDAIPSAGFLWLGNPESNFKREKVYFGSYSGGTFSNLKRGVGGTTAGNWGDDTIVEVAGAITFASAPTANSDLFVKYEFAGDVVDRDLSDSESEIFFLDESENSATGWAPASARAGLPDSDKVTTVSGATARAKLRGTEISAVLDFAKSGGGVAQFILDEGTRNEKRILVDSSSADAAEKIKSLATSLSDALHSLRIVANVESGATHLSAFLANGHAPLLEPALSSEVEYAEPLADLDPESDPNNFINLENAIGGNDSYTKLLIHSDTTDGSTTFEDSSQSGHTITANGNVAHSTTTQKFDDSAIHFDGDGDYLEIADSDDWNFGDGDFTIDFWMYAQTTSYDVIFTQYNGDVPGLDNIEMEISSNGQIRAYFANLPVLIAPADSSVMNSWHHIAYVRSGNSLYLFVDGVVKNSNTSSATMNDSALPLMIGRYNGDPTYDFSGYLDEFRISKGVARWTSDFTPPTDNYDIDIPTIEGVPQLALVEGLDPNYVADTDYWDTNRGENLTTSSDDSATEFVNLLVDLSASATEMTVESVDNLPSSGVVKIGSEYIKYGAKGTNGVTAKLLNLQRGYNNSIAAAHLAADSTETISGLSNVRDVFIYDTTKDSIDSGWRFDSTKSWYSETSSATRCPNGFVDSGATKCTRAFPAVAILVATTSNLYIYDAESRELWMSFSQSADAALGADTDNNLAAVAAHDSQIFVANNGASASGLHLFDFTNDTIRKFNSTDDYLSDQNIATRNSIVSWTASDFAPIVNLLVNDVSVTEIGGKTFVAAATDSGVSILDQTDSAVRDYADSAGDDYNLVALTTDGRLYAFNETLGQIERWDDIQNDSADKNPGTPDAIYDENSTPALLSTAITSLAVSGEEIYLGSDSGAMILREKIGTESEGSIKYLTDEFATEEMVGDVRGSWSFDDSINLADNSTNGNTFVDSGSATFATTGIRGNAATTSGGTLSVSIEADLTNYSFGGWIYETDTWNFYVRSVISSTATDYKNGAAISSGFTSALAYSSPNFTLADATTADELFFTATPLDAATISRMYSIGKKALASADEQKFDSASTIVKSVAVFGDSLFVAADESSSDDGAISKINLNSDSLVESFDTDSSFAGATIGTLDPVAVAANSAGVVFATATEIFVDNAEIQSVGVLAASETASWTQNSDASWYDEFGALPEKLYLVARESGIDIIDALENKIWASFPVGTGNALNSRVSSITHSESAIFVATENGVVKFDLAGDSISRFIGQKEFVAESCDGRGVADFAKIDSGNFCFADSRPLHDGNLAAQFDFELVEDSTTFDSSDNANDATIYGDTTFVANGISGRAATFDGTGDYLSIADDSTLDLTGNFTLATWVKTSQSTAGDIFNKFSDNQGYSLRVDTDGKFGVTTNNSSYLYTATGFNDDTWHYLSATWDGATMKIYVDGVLKNSGTGYSNPINTSYPLKIGVNQLGSPYFDGSLDSMTILNRAFSAAEIADLYTAGLASLRSGHATDLAATDSQVAIGTENIADATASKTFVVDQNIFVDPSVADSLNSGIVGEWDFDDSTTSVADRSGNANDGTPSGGTTFTADGISSRAATFDGTDDYLDIGDTGANLKTIAFWINPNSTTESILDLDGGTHKVSATAGTLAATGFASPTIYVDGSASSTIYANSWQFVAITTATEFAVSDFDLGRIATDYFGGSIDDVKIWNRAISEDEVTALFNSGRQVFQSADADAALTAMHFDSSGDLFTATNSAISKFTDFALGGFAADATKLASAIDATITAISDLADDATNLFVATNLGVEKLELETLQRNVSTTDTFLANSGGMNNLLVGSTNETRAVAFDSMTTELAVATSDGNSGTGAVSILREVGSTPLLERSYDQSTSSGDALGSDLSTSLKWMADYRSSSSSSYRKLLIGSEKGFSIVGVQNIAPSVPTLVSPKSGWQTTDSTPILSANYIAGEASDSGYTNYRVATSSADCLGGTNLTASGSSNSTSSASEATTWTVSEISADGTYFWCAQNSDGEDASAWTSMGNFVLDTATPDAVAVDAGPSSADRTSFASDTLFDFAETGSDGQISFGWTDPSSATDDEFYYSLVADPETALDNLVGWWKLDEEPDNSAGQILDYSGRENDGTSSGMVATESTAGMINSAIEFDGTDDFVDIGNISQNLKTIAFWINPDSTTESILDLDGGTHKISATAGTLAAAGFSSPTIFVDGVESSTISASSWQFVAITTATEFAVSDFDLGRISTDYFAGAIDDLKIWNTALTESQIQSEYSRGRALNFEDDLVGWWKLNESPTGATAEIQDFSGNENHATTVGSMTSADSVAGKLNTALELDGVDDYLDVGDVGEINSLAFWIYPESDTTDIVDLDGGTHSIEIASGTLTATGFESPTIYINGAASSTFTTGQWQHVAITTATVIDANALRIGENFAGKIDDFRIYSTALSATEVANLYRTRATSSNALDDFPTDYPADDSDNALPGGRQIFHLRPSTGSGALGTERSFIASYSGSGPEIEAASLKIYRDDGITEITESETVVGEQSVKFRPEATDPDAGTVITIFQNLATLTGNFVATSTPTTRDADGLGNPACPSGTAYDDCASKVWYEMSTSGDYTLTPFDPTIEITGLPEGDYRTRAIATDESMPNVAVGFGSNPALGWISLNHSDTGYGAFYTSEYLEGWALSENAGWIKLYSGSPATTDCSEQPTQTTTDFGVMSDQFGNLCGYGYSEIFGWVSFMGDGYGVAITSDHQLIGHAFSEAVGWIAFNPSDNATETPNLCLFDSATFGCRFDNYEFEPAEFDLSMFDKALFQ